MRCRSASPATSPSIRRMPDDLVRRFVLGTDPAAQRARRTSSATSASGCRTTMATRRRTCRFASSGRSRCSSRRNDAEHALRHGAARLPHHERGRRAGRAISPDLTLHDPATLGHVGGPITHDETGTEIYATIFAFAESPVKAGVLWAGSDDGLVHVSRDNGATWQDVTPHFPGKFTRVSIIEPGHFDAGTAYLAAIATSRTTSIRISIAPRTTARAGRASTPAFPSSRTRARSARIPSQRGLLYAGTESGVYVSFDDGARWQSLQLNLPRSSARDLARARQRSRRRDARPLVLGDGQRLGAPPGHGRGAPRAGASSSRRTPRFAGMADARDAALSAGRIRAAA